MVKQVIVIRRDLKMRRGKEIAQGAHASMAWLLDRLRDSLVAADRRVVNLPWFAPSELEWLLGEFKKVTCAVESEAKLRALYSEAVAAGVKAHLITDLGRTEFKGAATITALAIGPDTEDRIDPITRQLPLY